MKYHYDPSERICSDDFDFSAYWNRDALRQFKRETKTAKTSDDFTEIFRIINDSGFVAIFELVDYINEHNCELRETLMSNFYQFKSYIDSKSKMLELKHQYNETIKRLELDNKVLRKMLFDSQDAAKALVDQNKLLRQYVMEFEDGLTLLQVLDLGLQDAIPIDSND